MKWLSSAYQLAILVGAFGSSVAFLSPRRCTTTSSSLSVSGLGWDNDNFLDSLSKGPEAIEEANREYERLKRFGTRGAEVHLDADDFMSTNVKEEGTVLPEEGVTGASLTPEQIERIKKQNEEDGGGGEMFKRLLERAQQGAVRRPPPPPPPQPTTQPSTGSALPAGFENLSVEAQAALFRELMANPTQQQPFPTTAASAPPATPGQSEMAPNGRRIGRNRDADAINNTSDVYFAQLKRDSTIRTLARQRGEYDKAEKVFEDPEIHKIQLHTNPYMEEARKKEREMLETSEDELIVPEMFVEPKVDVSDRGVSYKEKLDAMRQRKGQGVQKQKKEAPMPTAHSSPQVDAPIPKSTAAPVESRPMVQPVQQPATTTTQTFVPAEPQTAAKPVAQSDTARSPKEEPEFRKDVRTLMGLLLKHRGGPGFGAGRIRGTEKDRFVELAEQVIDVLRTETPLQQQPSKTVSSVSPSASRTAPTVTGGIEMTGKASLERMNSMVACVEGAITMYRNSPPELQSSVLVTLRAALLSAAGTCNDIVGDNASHLNFMAGSGSSRETPANERIRSMLACVDGAITMYKNSPPELQQAVLVTLRAALLSAISTCNEIIAENDNGTFMPSVATIDPVVSTPAQFTDLTPEKPVIMKGSTRAVEESVSTYSGNDENSQFLETVYHQLQKARGEGTMGLRNDLTPLEAEELAASIRKMRLMLVDELENGIPE